jgi:hypothetical protein
MRLLQSTQNLKQNMLNTQVDLQTLSATQLPNSNETGTNQTIRHQMQKWLLQSSPVNMLDSSQTTNLQLLYEVYHALENQHQQGNPSAFPKL